MKKSIIASVVALGMVSGLAQAAVNEVQFLGNVTTVSCDLVPSVDGSKNPNGVSQIQLGDVATNATGKTVGFTFKPAGGTQNEDACDKFAQAANSALELTWSGDKFTNNGLGVLDGYAASGSNVQITPVNSTNAQASYIKANGEKHAFNGSVLAKGGDGLKYNAVLQAGPTPGAFAAAATFNVTYK